MSSVIKFTPLSGAKNEGPLCYLLQIDDFHILLDCGWDENFSIAAKHIQELKKIAPKIDIVLLSHADIQHAGALPYAVGKLGLKAEVFCTLPVSKMGQMFMYDAYQSKLNQEHEFSVFNLDDVDNAFETKVHLLKYSQRYQLKGDKAGGIIIAPFVAGHTLGGTVWKISKETDEIIYCVDFNHKKERHLNAANLEALGKPSIMITDAYNALVKELPKNLEKQFLDKVQSTLRNNGNVLIPSDAAGRVLELLLILERHWRREKGNSNYGLVFLTTMSFRTAEFASHQLEWMSESIVKGFDERRENPFQFKYVRLLHKLEDLQKVPVPMVVVTTSNTLEMGYSQHLFAQWADNPRNLVLLTDRSLPNTLGRRLHDQIQKGVRLTSLSMVLKKRVPLQGEELEEALRVRRLKREAEKRKKREEEQRKKVIEIHDEEEEKDSKMDMEKNEAPSHPALFLPENMRYHSQHLMFPCIEPSFQYDEYGQIANIEELKAIAAKVYDQERMEIEEEDRLELMKLQQLELEPEKEEMPTKIISKEVQVFVNCNIEYLNFEGRANARSIQNILQRVNPRKLIIIHGTSEATEALASFCKNKKVSETVETPNVLQTIDISMDTNMFKVKLKEELLSHVDFIKYGPYDLAFIEGEYIYEQDDKMPSICPKSNEESKGHSSIMIGDLKLSKFRDVLVKAGFSTQFQAGKLICNNAVVLKKDEHGEITIEGGLCEDYFAVRNLLFSQYQVL